jgi:hypothetical protein
MFFVLYGSQLFACKILCYLGSKCQKNNALLGDSGATDKLSGERSVTEGSTDVIAIAEEGMDEDRIVEGMDAGDDGRIAASLARTGSRNRLLLMIATQSSSSLRMSYYD